MEYEDQCKQKIRLKQYPRRFLRNAYLDLKSWQHGSIKSGMYTICMHAVFDDNKQQFRDFILFLQKYGRFVTPTEAGQQSGRQLNEVLFHLTFDDGLECVYRNAREVLNEFNIKATFFIPTAIFDLCSSGKAELAMMNMQYSSELSFMDVAAVNTLLAEGHFLGNHTHSHPNLKYLDDDKFLHEINHSQAIFEKIFQITPKEFAWPNGGLQHITLTQLKRLQANGFKTIYSCIRGNADHKFGYKPRHHFEPWFPLRHVLPLLKQSAE